MTNHRITLLEKLDSWSWGSSKFTTTTTNNNNSRNNTDTNWGDYVSKKDSSNNNGNKSKPPSPQPQPLSMVETTTVVNDNVFDDVPLHQSPPPPGPVAATNAAFRQQLLLQQQQQQRVFAYNRQRAAQMEQMMMMRQQQYPYLQGTYYGDGVAGAPMAVANVATAAAAGIEAAAEIATGPVIVGRGATRTGTITNENDEVMPSIRIFRRQEILVDRDGEDDDDGDSSTTTTTTYTHSSINLVPSVLEDCQNGNDILKKGVELAKKYNSYLFTFDSDVATKITNNEKQIIYQFNNGLDPTSLHFKAMTKTDICRSGGGGKEKGGEGETIIQIEMKIVDVMIPKAKNNNNNVQQQYVFIC